VPKAHLLLVTGLSGAGKSTALAALEDLGYEVVDNLPLRLLRTLLDGSSENATLAIGTDSRTVGFSSELLLSEINELKKVSSINITLIFLTCDTDVLHLRFTETRRRHPLAIDRPVTDGILHERQLMRPLLDQADHVIDTSHLNASDLRVLVDGSFSLTDGPPFTISITSFAFRKGLPRESDLVLDVRFLSNPYYVERLRERTGLDEDVAEYVESDPDFAGFFTRLSRMIIPLLPRYAAEGKRYLTIAIGCTGGHHRSVVVAEHLAKHLIEADFPVQVRHRDLSQIAIKSRNIS
jgi:UPF0042 nucleotide-binding protein|tara:strand:+ start:1938 stop:2819 length:882 start_codon:yes stop_codon:yes gene_type:complete